MYAMNDMALALNTGRISTGLEQRREGSTLDHSRSMDQFLAEVEKRAYRMAVISVRNRDDALDIVQDAMIRLVRKYADRPGAEWRPLFYRILNNRILDHHRRQTIRNKMLAWFSRNENAEEYSDPLENAPGPATIEPHRRMAIDDAMGSLEEAVRELSARQQQAFLLRTLEGLDVATTAATMGCSQGSVKTHYSRAVHQLREKLGDHWL